MPVLRVYDVPQPLGVYWIRMWSWSVVWDISLVVVPTQEVVDSGLCRKTDLMSDDTHYSVRGISETATVFE
jgi:hypothetical protein